LNAVIEFALDGSKNKSKQPRLLRKLTNFMYKSLVFPTGIVGNLFGKFFSIIVLTKFKNSKSL
jgi:hypothetical protein